jgi:hypothetical protein
VWPYGEERKKKYGTYKPHVPPYTYRMIHYTNTAYVKWSPDDTIE